MVANRRLPPPNAPSSFPRPIELCLDSTTVGRINLTWRAPDVAFGCLASRAPELTQVRDHLLFRGQLPILLVELRRQRRPDDSIDVPRERPLS